MIKIEHLTKNYGSNCAVDDISFEVKKGETVGFLSVQIDDVLYQKIPIQTTLAIEAVDYFFFLEKVTRLFFS